MASRKKIVVLFHERNNLRNINSYSIVFLANLWRERGYDVKFLFGASKFVDADLCFVHVDLSVVPQEYLELAQQYPAAINGNSSDIRKSSFSRNLLGEGDSYDGRVIVKTDLNYGGWPEIFLNYPLPVRAGMRFLNKLPGIDAFPCTSHDYQVFDSLQDVPEKYWTDKRFVVEKFLPEVEDGIYYSRSYLFFGNSSVCNRRGSRHPIVKDNCALNPCDVTPHPDIVNMRHELQIDYGKLDYNEVNGEAVLIDVNRTFTFSRPAYRDEVAAEIFHRENALESFF